MNANQALSAQTKPEPFDLFLVVIGPTVLAAVQSNLFTGSARYAALGLAAGCVLAAIAWCWPKVAGPGLLVLSIPGMLYSLFLALYTIGMAYTLFLLWGATAFLAGGVGVLRRARPLSDPEGTSSCKPAWSARWPRSSCSTS